MSVSQTGGVIAITGSDRPLVEPDAMCEGCGARGTVGRAGRGDAANAKVEEHLFCANCWPEWSAFYRARWQEQARRAHAAWRAPPTEAGDTAPPVPSGMWFESATWHAVIELVRKLTLEARYYRDPPSHEALARYAADIRAQAPTRVGPIPYEVRAFLAEFGRES